MRNHRNKYKWATWLIFLMFSAQILNSQDRDSSLVTLFEEYTKTAYPEQILVHLDRNYYLAGEHIWFSVYCLEEDSYLPSEASTVAYIELLDQDGRAIVQKKIELTEGKGNGCLEIPMSCRSEEHFVRCYTTWQRNFGPLEYHYNKVLIIHPSRSYQGPDTTAAAEEVHLEFFPEGGELTEGVINHVVFTATDQQNQALNCSLRVISEDTLLLAGASTFRKGIGAFSLLPEKGKNYQVMVSGPELKQQAQYSIPEAEDYACALKLGRVPSGQQLTLRPGPEVLKRNRKLKLLAWTRTGIQFLEVLNIDTLIQLEFREDKLPRGRNFLTVFDERNNILAERVFYTCDKNPIALATPGLKDSYHPREAVEFTLETSSSEGKPLFARSSLAVSMSGTYAKHSALNSFTGNFTSDTLKDLHAITYSKGSCSWIHEAPAKITYLPEMEGLMISGIIQHNVSREPLEGVHMVLSLIDSIPEFYTSTSNEDGRFHFLLDPMHGKRDLIIQPYGTHDGFLITLDDEFTTEPLPEMIIASLDQENLPELFEELLLNQQLNQSYFTRSELQKRSRYPGQTFYGAPDQQIVMTDFIRLPVMEEVFRELGKRVFLGGQGNSYKVSLLDLETNRIIGDNPMYLIDGVPFFSSEKLLNINPGALKRINFKSEKYFLNDLRMDGIIDIRTNDGRADLIEFSRSAVRKYFQGFQQEVCFPSVAEHDQHALRLPLYKSTLFFDPGILTSPSSESRIRFIAPDRKGAYDIIIKILGRDGEIAEDLITFVVE